MARPPDLVANHKFEATVADVLRAGPEMGAQWFVIRTNPRCEFRALRGLEEIGLLAYAPCETKHRGRGAARRAVQYPLLVSYIFVHLAEGRSFWEARRIDGVEAFLMGANGHPEPIPHRFIARFAKAEREGRYDRTINAKEAKREVDRLRMNLGDLQALGPAEATARIMSILDEPEEWDEAA